MASIVPILNQATVDRNGFRLFARPSRTVANLLLGLGSVCILAALVLHGARLAPYALGVLSIALCSVGVAFFRARYELSVTISSKSVTVVDVVGLEPLRRFTDSVDRLSHVEFGECKDGRQQLFLFWSDPETPPIQATLFSAADREGDLARAIRRVLDETRVKIVNSAEP